MNDYSNMFSGPIGLIIGLLLFIWAVLMFFAPFFWYGTNNRTREISEKMDKLIKAIEESKPDR